MTAEHDSTTQAWRELSTGYERARAREDSLDRIVKWPAQRALLGEVAGRSTLDLGCGGGSKITELVSCSSSPAADPHSAPLTPTSRDMDVARSRRNQRGVGLRHAGHDDIISEQLDGRTGR